MAALIPLHMQDDDEKPPELVYVHTAPHKLQYYSRRHRMSQRLHTRAARCVAVYLYGVLYEGFLFTASIIIHC